MTIWRARDIEVLRAICGWVSLLAWGLLAVLLVALVMLVRVIRG